MEEFAATCHARLDSRRNTFMEQTLVCRPARDQFELSGSGQAIRNTDALTMPDNPMHATNPQSATTCAKLYMAIEVYFQR